MPQIFTILDKNIILQSRGDGTASVCILGVNFFIKLSVHGKLIIDYSDF